MATLLVAPTSLALFQVRQGWTKCLLRTQSRALAEELARRVGGEVADEGFVLYVRDDRIEELRSLAKGIELLVRPDSEFIESGRLRLDVRIGLPSEIRPSERITSYEPAKKSLYVIQFVGPLRRTYEVQLTGARIVGSLHHHAAVVVATPEEASVLSELPFLQWVQPFHPIQKSAWEGPPPLSAKTRWRVHAYLIDAPDVADALAEISRFATYMVSFQSHSGLIPVTFDVAGLDQYQHIKRNRLLLGTTFLGLAQPELQTAIPRRSLPGRTAIISGSGFLPGTIVRIGDETVPTEFLDPFRVRVSVPAHVPEGPVDVYAQLPNGSNQVLDGDSPFGLKIGRPASRSTIGRDHIVSLRRIPTLIQFTDRQNIVWSDEAGDQLLSVDLGSQMYSNAACGFFDPSGIYHAVYRDRVERLDARMNLLSPGPSFLAGASDVVMNAADEFIVLRGRHIQHLTLEGVTVSTSTLPVEAIDIDLESNQCGVVYAHSRGIGRHDICRDVSLEPVLRTGQRVSNVVALKDGYLALMKIDLTTNELLHVHGGEVIQRRTFDYSYSAALALDSSGTNALVSSGSSLMRYEIATGHVTPLRTYILASHLAVYCGWSAARGDRGHPSDPQITALHRDGTGGSVTYTLYGEGFSPGFTATIGDTPALSTEWLDARTVRFTASHFDRGTIVLTNPNGLFVSVEDTRQLIH